MVARIQGAEHPRKVKSDENLRAAQPVLTAFLTSYKLAAGKLIGAYATIV